MIVSWPQAPRLERKAVAAPTIMMAMKRERRSGTGRMLHVTGGGTVPRPAMEDRPSRRPA
ncbi:MAG: hypothetical protein ACKOEX_11520 [Planctomycetia bacterium]